MTPLHRGNAVWPQWGEKLAVWRCASRVDYGTKYCHHSPTFREKPLQAAILAAINTVMSQREVLVGQIESTLRTTLVPLPGGSMSEADRPGEDMVYPGCPAVRVVEGGIAAADRRWSAQGKHPRL